MPKDRLFTLALGALAVTGFALWQATVTRAPDWLSFVYLAVALLVLALYDVWLPRGDAADMTGAVAFAATIFLSPGAAVLAVVGSRLAALVVRHGREPALRVVSDLFRRLLALSAGALTLFGLGGWPFRAGRPDVYAYGRLTLAAIVFFVVDFVVAQMYASARLDSPVLPLMVGTMRLMGWMLAAHICVAILTVPLFGAMSVWGLLISVALLLVMRQSFSLLIKTKETYRATVEVLARAIEAQDPNRRGHAERVASLVQAAARSVGIHGHGLESLMYAALFHDVGRLGEDRTLGDAGAPRGSAEVLADVCFFVDVLPVLQILDTWGNLEASQTEEAIVAAYLIARMSAFDDLRMRMPSAGAEARWARIGTRLYANRRSELDKVILRVQERARRTNVMPAPLLGEDF